MTEFAGVLLMLVFFEALAIIGLIVVWRQDKKRHSMDEISHHLHEEEIFNTVALQIDRLMEKAERREKRIKDIVFKPKNAYLRINNHHKVVCLIDQLLEPDLYIWVDQLRIKPMSEFDHYNRLLEILQMFIFVPVPDGAPSPYNRIPAYFTSTDQKDMDHRWTAHLYAIELYDGVGRTNERNIHAIPMNRGAYISGVGWATTTIDDKRPIFYNVEWKLIFDDKHHVFINIDELKFFVETLYEDPEHLKMVYNSNEVTHESLQPPPRGFRFDPEWLANRKEG